MSSNRNGWDSTKRAKAPYLPCGPPNKIENIKERCNKRKIYSTYEKYMYVKIVKIIFRYFERSSFYHSLYFVHDIRVLATVKNSAVNGVFPIFSIIDDFFDSGFILCLKYLITKMITKKSKGYVSCLYI